jgi:glycosidase
VATKTVFSRFGESFPLDNDAKVYPYDGALVPASYRFDPTDAAHLSRTRDGGVRFRLVTAPGVLDARVQVRSRDDLHSHAMELELDGTVLQVWTASVELADGDLYSLAFLDAEHRAYYLTTVGFAGAVERLDRWTVDLAAIPLIDTPEWVEGAVIYQIFPDRFANGDPSTDPEGVDPWGAEPRRDGFQGGDLAGIEQHLDHLERLGVDVLYLNPVVTSPSNHRYDASDYHHVDPILGGDAAFDSLRAATRARDIRLLVDLSINHCHPQHEAFADVRDKGPESAYWSWFKVEEWPLKVRYRPQSRPPGFEHFSQSDADAFTELTGIPFEQVDDDGPFIETTYDSWYGVPSMPRFDLTNPETRNYLFDVGVHWLTRFDADGIRMDVARYIEMDVWREARPVFRAAKGDAYLLCEIFGEAHAWLQGDTFDGVMNYIGRDLVREFAAGTLDGEGLAAGIERLLASVTPEATRASQLLLGSHDVDRFLTMVDGDRDALHLATVLQLTLPGAPSIFYGDEVYLEGGHDPEMRKAFPWGEEVDSPLVGLIAELTELRRKHSVLRTGWWRPLHVEADVIAFSRWSDEGELIVLVNRGDVPTTLEVGDARLVWGDGAAVADGAVFAAPHSATIVERIA